MKKLISGGAGLGILLMFEEGDFRFSISARRPIWSISSVSLAFHESYVINLCREHRNCSQFYCQKR